MDVTFPMFDHITLRAYKIDVTLDSSFRIVTRNKQIHEYNLLLDKMLIITKQWINPGYTDRRWGKQLKNYI